MKIAYIVSKYPTVSHTFVQREVLALRQLGWEVTTLSVRRAARTELLTESDKMEDAGTKVIITWNPFRLAAAIGGALLFTPGRFLRGMKSAQRLRRPGIRGAIWALFYFAEALLVHRLARKEGLHHFHAHFANVASDVAMIAAVLGRGGVHHPNNATFSFTMHGPTEFFDVAQHRLAEKARAAKLVICISDFARSQLMALLPPEQWSKLRVVHCGVDLDQFKMPRTAGARLRRAAAEEGGAAGGNGGGRVVEILCVARLAPVKGHAILLRMLEELSLRGHEARLTLIGDGPLRKSLEQLAEVMGIQGRVRFLGNVGQDAIHHHYASADVFVLPSFAEGVPVVLMEAMAAACPVVATRINGIPELIEDGVTGLLVPPGRADLLADAVERVVAGPRAAERMAAAGREKIRREFNVASAALRLDRIFRRVIAEKGGLEMPRRPEEMPAVAGKTGAPAPILSDGEAVA